MSKPAYRFISRGFAAQNKKRGKAILEIIPVDITPDLQDAVTPATRTVERKGITYDGSEYTVKIEKGATIPAIWKGSTNRRTPPDVRRHERVNLYQVGDSEIYYWESAGLDDHLRRLETVIWTFSDIPENSDAMPSAKNTWSWAISTHDGHATFQTTMSNGEKAAWTCQFDCRNGKFTVEDHKENYAYIDSVENDIKFRNADDSFFQLNKKVINLYTGTWNVRTKAIDVKTDTFTFEAKSVTMTVNGVTKYKASNTIFDSPVEFKQAVTVNASMSATKPVTFSAKVTAQDASFKDVTVNTISGNSHSFPH